LVLNLGYRYQCSRETFEQAGYTPEDGVRIMQRSVKLANDARKAYLAEEEEGGGATAPTTPKEIFIALSLGPFGSTINPPQDFDGFYPPPFGPKGPSSLNGANTRLFSSSNVVETKTLEEEEEEEEEEKAIEALAEFHLWRLRAVASDPETWNSINYIAFETVPHLRELRAIKAAMARFDAEIRTARGEESSGSLIGARSSRGLLLLLRGWWVSLVFPDGGESVQWGPEEREGQTRSLGLDLTKYQSGILNVVLDERIGAVPTGLGINCTRIDQYPSILSSILSDSKYTLGVEKTPVPLTLIVYPNGGRIGDRFDLLTYRWKNDGGSRPDGRNVTWEEEVVEVVQKCQDEWKDVIVGGCCRVYPPQIKILREKVNKGL